MPKQVHNVRVRVTDHEKDTVKTILDSFIAAAGIERKDIELIVTSDQDPSDPLYIGEIWIDHQQPVRKAIKLLQDKLSVSDKASINTKPEHHLDTGTHAFVKLDKKKFLAGEFALLKDGSMVHIRMNIAAFPATKENAAKILKELF